MLNIYIQMKTKLKLKTFLSIYRPKKVFSLSKVLTVNIL